MATITSAASGSPLAGATWVGGVAPDIGDDFVIANGHTITLALGDTWTVGNDGAAGTLAGKVQSGGTLVCNGQANFRGDFVHHRGGTVTGGPGGKIVLDSGTVGVYYKWIGNDTGSGFATFNTTSTSSSAFVVSGDGGRGGDKGYVNWGEGFAYLYHTMALHNVRFEDLGTSARKGFFGMAWAAGSSISTINACWLRCGDVRLYRGTNGAFNLQSIAIRLPVDLDTDSHVLNIDEQVVTTSAKTIGSLTIYTPNANKTLAYVRLSNLTVTRAVIGGVYFYPVGNNVTIKEMFLLNAMCFSKQDSNFLCESAICFSRTRNPHWFHEIGPSQGLGRAEVYKTVLDGDGYFESDTGDCFLPLGEYYVEQAISINESGVLANPQNAAARITIKNSLSSRAYGLVSGEALIAAQAYVSVSDCIFYKQSEGMHQLSSHAAQTSMVVDYNCCYEMNNTHTLYDYNINGTYTNVTHPAGGFLSYVGQEVYDEWIDGASYGGTGFGANDISVNPQFVDDTVTVRSWGDWDTHTDAMRELVTIDGIAYDGAPTTPTTKTAAQCWDYIAAGFTPTNMTLLTAGSDGGFIGAVEPVSADDTAPVISSLSATSTGTTTATLTVATDEGNGSVYFLLDANASATEAAILAGLSQSVTATGEQTIDVTALGHNTTYYAHVLHKDAANNVSNILHSSAFKTADLSITLDFPDTAPCSLLGYQVWSKLTVTDEEIAALWSE